MKKNNKQMLDLPKETQVHLRNGSNQNQFLKIQKVYQIVIKSRCVELQARTKKEEEQRKL